MSAAAAAPFFDQIGIVNVVWLDDLFDAKTVPNEIDIAEQMAVAIAAGTLVPHPKLDDLSSEDSAQEWARRVRERLDASEIVQFLNEIAPRPPAMTAARPADYTAGELEAVVGSLGSTIQRVGLMHWSEVKERLIGAATGGVFLVDRERVVGGVVTNVGDDIVKELIERCAEDVLVLVLTHSVGPDGAEILRNLLATELAVPFSRLGVVSKRPEGASLTNGVRAAVRTSLTQLTCAVLTRRIANAMRESLVATEVALSALPVQALDRAVFENSLKEGASEIDVLARILSSRQRSDVEARIAGALDDVHSPLARMRSLRLLEPLPELPAGDAGLLLRWRRDEVFEVGATLNALRSPIGSGDVFQKDGSKSYFVLLGQPCDLMVRPDGHRRTGEAVLVRLAVGYSPVAGSEGRYFEVPALVGTARWALDLRKWVSVNLDCLEWTSFNADGRVAFSPSPQPPTGLLPGWEKRFARARSKFKEGRQYCLSLGDISGRVATAAATTVEFPYRRVARLRGPRASGAYAAFANFQARGAFEHDFSEGLGEAPQTQGSAWTGSEEGPQAAPKTPDL